MATINTPGNLAAGQTVAITVTGLTADDGSQATWNSSLGSTFSPNPSNVSGGVASTNYTPGSGGSDLVSVSDGTDADNTDTTVSVAAGGGGGGGTIPAWASNANVLSTYATLTQVADFTSTAACAPVKAFQAAVAAAGGPVTYSGAPDGGYGAETAAAAGQVAAYLSSQGATQNAPGPISSGFPNCGGTPAPPQPNPQPITKPTGWPMWLKVVLWIIVSAGAVGLAFWLYKTFGSSNPAATAAEPRRKGKRSKKKK